MHLLELLLQSTPAVSLEAEGGLGRWAMDLLIEGWLPLLVVILWGDALRRIFRQGRTANDVSVAITTSLCLGFLFLILVDEEGPIQLVPLWGMVSVWGLFFALDRKGPTPGWVRWLLAWPSQVFLGLALLGLLTSLVLVVPALLLDWDLRLPRWLWGGLLALSAYLVIFPAWKRWQVRWFQVPGLPLRVVQLSDIHVSPLQHARELKELLSRVEALRPELVVITGDLLMPFSEHDHAYLVEALASLPAPVVLCPGNHDLPVLERFHGELAEQGIRLLVDEALYLNTPGGGNLEVVGVTFHHREAASGLLNALATLPPPPPGTYRLLLAHDPAIVRWVPADRFDLVLSGHVHGGQISGNPFGLPFSLFRLLGVRDQGWWWAKGQEMEPSRTAQPRGIRLHWRTGQGDAQAEIRHFVHSGNHLIGLPPRLGAGTEVVLLEGTETGVQPSNLPS